MINNLSKQTIIDYVWQTPNDVLLTNIRVIICCDAEYPAILLVDIRIWECDKCMALIVQV